MSLLRDRLRELAKERERAPKAEEAPEKAADCALRTASFPLKPLRLTEEGLKLLTGDEEAAKAYRSPEGLAFLDVETTGLSRGAGTVAFEIGLGRIRGGRMEVCQLWMRDYGEEEAMLRRLMELMDGAELIVSFNGKNFDVPMLENRMILNRLRPSCLHLPQIDLMYPARRMFKLRLKSCTLTHLEERVLGHVRKDDVPGVEIPALWWQFLKDKDEAPLEKVFEHNAQDVFSMALLLQALHDGHLSPLEMAEAADVYSVGRVLERAGNVELAERCYIRASEGTVRSLSGVALNRIYRRQGRWDEQQAALERMAHAGSGGVFPYVELAKLYEHRFRNIPLALRATESAMTVCTTEEEMDELRKRRARLKARLERRK